jgi:hypothetical protein
MDTPFMGNNRQRRQVEPGGDDVLVRTRREVAQAVEAASDAFVPSSGACVVEQGAPVHARLERLFGGEVACLAEAIWHMLTTNQPFNPSTAAGGAANVLAVRRP